MFGIDTIHFITLLLPAWSAFCPCDAIFVRLSLHSGLCAFQSDFWHSRPQYETVWHDAHVLIREESVPQTEHTTPTIPPLRGFARTTPMSFSSRTLASPPALRSASVCEDGFLASALRNVKISSGVVGPGGAAAALDDGVDFLEDICACIRV